MSSITARVPDIDWSKGFDRHWCGGSPTATHWYNAISFLLPSGEKFFRDVAREVARDLDLSGNPRLEQEVRDFAVQESLHAAQHHKYNAVLEAQGFKNVVDHSIRWWIDVFHRNCSPLTKLATVCAYEHFTAVLSDHLLTYPGAFDQHSPDMALLWGWHAVEETEHKAVCFDLYTAAGGGWLRRISVFLLISLAFNVLFFGRAYFYLLRTDGCLRLKRAPGAAATRLGRRDFLGPVGINMGPALRYLSPRFHPWGRDIRAQMEAWLLANESRLIVVGKVSRNTLEPAM